MQQGPRQPEIKFTPLSDGLGFHPFSDGLPYAPVGKTTSLSQAIPAMARGALPTQPGTAPSAGAGATAAGAPSFVTPSRPIPRVSVPVASGILPAPQPHPYLQQPLHPAQRQQQQAQSPIDALAAQEFGFVYLIRRFFAYGIDTAFNLTVCIVALSVALWKQNLNPDLLLTPSIVVIAALFLAVFNWALTTAQEIAFGTSVGKRLFGLALNGSTAAIFLRAFFFLPSLGFGGLGILWAMLNRRKRCWHDMIVDLQPIELG